MGAMSQVFAYAQTTQNDLNPYLSQGQSEVQRVGLQVLLRYATRLYMMLCSTTMLIWFAQSWKIYTMLCSMTVMLPSTKKFVLTTVKLCCAQSWEIFMMLCSTTLAL